MYKLGIDLGGTNIVAGVVDENFNIVATAKRKTNCPRPADEILDDMAAVALQAVEAAGLKKEDIEAAGVGSPGAIDPANGVVCFAGNLGFHNLAMAEMLKERTGFDFYLENDANAAAYGEYVAGAGKGTNNFMMITLGTGVGGGIIIDGKLYSGSNYAGAELGHVVISMDGEMCSCGRQGCWEAYASATALIRQTKQAMIKYPESIMWKLCGNDINAVNGLTAFEAMRQGDSAGKAVVDKYIYYIAVGIANNINIFQPDVICIGGGVSKEGDNLIIPIKEFVNGDNFARNIDKKAEIKTATLGNDAGIIGAAYLCNLYK
ncbi:MAG: ROK family protein [Acutalibacteraceae bacterium]|nr:ROK family protein [Acutalibacteraceae bacterium]